MLLQVYTGMTYELMRRTDGTNCSFATSFVGKSVMVCCDTRYICEMSATRTVRGKERRPAVHDPVVRRLYNRRRRESAPEGFVTRRTLCETLGLSDHQLRVLAKTNVLTSDGVNNSGYALYKTETLNRLIAMKSDGSLFQHVAPRPNTPDDVPSRPAMSATLHYSAEDGVRVFELLRDGKTLAEIILATRIHPMVVKSIRVDYDDITGSIHLPQDVVARMNALGNAGKLPGAFPLRDANDVFAIVDLCAIDRTCSTCEANAALTSCEDCLVKERRATLAMSRTGTG